MATVLQSYATLWFCNSKDQQIHIVAPRLHFHSDTTNSHHPLITYWSLCLHLPSTFAHLILPPIYHPTTAETYPFSRAKVLVPKCRYESGLTKNLVLSSSHQGIRTTTLLYFSSYGAPPQACAPPQPTSRFLSLGGRAHPSANAN